MNLAIYEYEKFKILLMNKNEYGSDKSFEHLFIPIIVNNFKFKITFSVNS